MKELSIEEKARRYDGAIKRLEDIETGNCQKTFMFTEGLFDYIFPELKMSEDERIRKALINGFNKLDKSSVWYNGITNGQILAWLLSKLQPQPKQEWSEEDEYCRHQLIVFCENCMQPDSGAIRCANWLKSLRPQSQWKPSDEQMGVIEAVINNRSFQRRHLDSLYADLKKLREE